MAMTNDQMNAITHAIVVDDGGKAVDNYFNSSAFCTRFLKQKKGLYKALPGGPKIKVPVRYDENVGGFYSRGQAVSSDVRETLNNAYYLWKNCYGNGTALQQDEAMASGPSEEVDLVEEQTENAMETAGLTIARSIYDGVGDSSKFLTGLVSATSESSSVKYGDIAEDDMVSTNGSKVWEGKTTTTTEALYQTSFRTLIKSAKTHDGPKGKPKLGLLPEDLLNSFKDLLDPAQRLGENKDTTKLGFTNLVFDNVELLVDDFCPDGNLFLINDNYMGFAVMKSLNFKVDPWTKLQTPGPPGRTMKVYVMLNLINSRRAAHARHTNLS